MLSLIINCLLIYPGTLTSITNFASSVSRNMERLSFDMEHIQRSEVLRRHKPSHVSEGLRNGLSGLGLSILGVFSTSEHCVVVSGLCFA